MTHRLRLPALLGSHPLGALASFGLLRKLAEIDPAVRLYFSLEDDWVAVLQTESFETENALVDKLVEWIGADIFDRLTGWADDARVQPHEFRSLLAHALLEGDLVMANFLSAIVADGATDAEKGLTKPSAFYMVSGQQSFLGGVREILSQVRADPQGSFREALVGPWRYKMRAHSLGWDPSAERLHALRHKAPTSEKPVCIGGAVILAFWALPLFPAVASGRRQSTIGFTRQSRDQFFSWPVWSVPIDLWGLTSLLHGGVAQWVSRQGRLRTGITAVYRSQRAEFGQGYAVLRPAEVVHRDTMTGRRT